MKIDGACLCGHVSYEADIDPEAVRICHCSDCQTSSATAFRIGVPVERKHFRLLSGALRVYVKTAESGAKRALSFCPDCGASIHGADHVEPKTYSLRLGTARQRHELVPRLQIWRRSALKWLPDLENVRSIEQQRRPE